jgi:hypothetical protein
MTRVSASEFYTAEQIALFVKATGEDDFVDAKAPCSWHGDDRASLAKDIAAFANSGGGGAIVIGKRELENNSFEYAGIDEEQQKSFDTTKVAQWVNNHFKPDVRLVCHNIKLDSKRYTVITVAEFGDTPHICTKTYQNERSEVILRDGTIYVRTANAQSAPLSTPEQVSNLISRAFVKRKDQLRELLDSVLTGHTTRSVPTDEEHFAKQLHVVESDLLNGIKGDKNQGAWRLVIHPETFVQRWQSPRELSDVILQTKLGSRRFPQEFPRPLPRDWGISGNYHIWGLTTEGMFYYWEPYRENAVPWGPQNSFEEESKTKKLDPSQWINYIWAVYMVGDFFAFAKRFSELFEAGSQIRYQIVASDLTGRHIVFPFGGAELRDLDYQPCAVRSFSHAKTIPAGRITGAWKELFSDCLLDFVHRFPGGEEMVHRSTVESWVEKYSSEFGLKADSLTLLGAITALSSDADFVRPGSR